MRVGAGEVGLQHQLGHLGGVGLRQAGLDHGVGNQRAHRGGRDAPRLHRRVHATFSGSRRSAFLVRIAALSASETFKPRTCATQSSMAMS